MAILRPRATAPMRPQTLAGLLATDLKALISGIVSRPDHARPARGDGTVTIAAQVPPAALKAEIDALPSNQRLVENASFNVYWARARQTPGVLQEIGRLRELAFRAVGE